jgi:hypothetical protein
LGENFICAKPSRLAFYRRDKHGPTPMGIQGHFINFFANMRSFHPIAMLLPLAPAARPEHVTVADPER